MNPKDDRLIPSAILACTIREPQRLWLVLGWAGSAISYPITVYVNWPKNQNTPIVGETKTWRVIRFAAKAAQSSRMKSFKLQAIQHLCIDPDEPIYIWMGMPENVI